MTVPQSEQHPDLHEHHLPDAEAELPPLRVGVRILLFVLGGLLLVIGWAGVVLPLVPAIVLVPLGAALLTLASDRLNRRLRAFVMRRWPSGWQRVQHFRAWLHHRLS